MLRYSLKMEKQATAIEQAIRDTISGGTRTGDLVLDSNQKAMNTREVTDEIIKKLG